MKLNRNTIRNYTIIVILIIILIVTSFFPYNFPFQENMENPHSEETLDIISKLVLPNHMKRDINDIVYNKQSKYQDIIIADFNKNDERCLFLDGEIQLCKNFENSYHELLVHLPASYVSKLERVLIIGGGDCMTLREVVKYKSLLSVDMIEIDQAVIDVSVKYLDVNNYSSDPRVNIIIGDAFTEIDKLQEDYYDLVIIDLTEDGTNNISVDSSIFYRKCAQKLKNDQKSVFVKNGTPQYDKVKSVFKNNRIYYLNSKQNKYNYVLSSNNIRLKNCKPINVESIQLNSTFEFYDHFKHDSYFTK